MTAPHYMAPERTAGLPQAAQRRLELAREIAALQEVLRAAPKGEPGCAEARVQAIAVLDTKLAELRRLKQAVHAQTKESDWTLLGRACNVLTRLLHGEQPIDPAEVEAVAEAIKARVPAAFIAAAEVRS